MNLIMLSVTSIMVHIIYENRINQISIESGNDEIYPRCHEVGEDYVFVSLRTELSGDTTIMGTNC